MSIEGFGRWETGWWSGDPGGQSRRQRAPGRYRMFIPSEIAEIEWQPNLRLVAELANVEAEIARLDGLTETRALRSLWPLLARQESIASSWIEGFQIGHRRLLQVTLQPGARDINASNVVGHLEALRLATDIGAAAKSFHVSDFKAIHRALFEQLPEPWSEIAGEVREDIVWVGGPSSTPVTADFVGPPPRELLRLLDDLARFSSRDDLPAVMQAALAHAQFETVRPFADGNGRVGRCLIHAILARRGLGTLVVPVSSVFARVRKTYIEGLTDYQAGEWERWLSFFVESTSEAVRRLAVLEANLSRLREEWRRRLEGIRSDAVDWRLLDVLLAQPVLTVAAAQQATGVSYNAAGAAFGRLEDRGVVVAASARRNREWRSEEVLELVAASERGRLTSPDDQS
jgi:Fic family protein